MPSSQNEPDVAKTSKNGSTKYAYFFSIGLALLVGFVGGSRSDEVMRIAGPVVGIKTQAEQLNFATVEQTYNALKNNFDGQLSNQALVDGMSRGLVNAAGDPHTIFLDAKDAEEFDKSISGDIGGGIGAEIGTRNDKPTVIRVLPDNPALKAGVKAGDVVVKVNGESAEGWDANKTATKIRGDAGTTVKIGVLRAEESKEFSITRAVISNPSVQSEIKDGVGIMTISRFDDKTGALAENIANKFKQQGVKGVVLDLRGNGGGYVEAAKEVAGLWLSNKLIVTERSGNEIKDKVESDADAPLKGIKTVVLVDGGSASASEIVAGALKDYSAAKLVGEKTFGKGSVQTIIDLSGGAKLKVTIAKWFTPKGKNIGKAGIEPDQKVAISADQINQGLDPQLEAAMVYFQ